MAMALDLSASRSACLGLTTTAAARRSGGPCMVVLPCRRDFRRPAMVCCSASGAPGNKQESVHPSRESITNVASESAVESPDQVHHQAESEAEPLARESGQPLEEIAGEIEAEAEQAASELTQAEETKGGSDSALQGLEMAKEAVQKRAKVLAMAAGEAGQKGSQFVDVAKKGIEELKQKLGNSNENSRRTEDERRQSPSSSEMLKHSAVDVEDVNKDGEAKLKEQRKRAEDANKHSAVDVEDVNKDGEATLKKQRNQAGQQDEAVKQVMEEFVEPARRGQNDDVYESSPELGDGNERFKNPGESLASHDQYGPIHDS